MSEMAMVKRLTKRRFHVDEHVVMRGPDGIRLPAIVAAVTECPEQPCWGTVDMWFADDEYNDRKQGQLVARRLYLVAAQQAELR